MSGKKKTTQQFVIDARKVHGKKYEYDLVVYDGCKNKVDITCPTHGKFDQTPDSHLQGLGCRYCTNTGVRDTTLGFMLKANKIHDGMYDYSAVDYIDSNNKVTIICKEHGKFEQGPQSHLRGSGCPNCKKSKLLGGYTEKFFNLHPEYQNISARLYLINLKNDVESFLKIGITKYTILSRFCKGKGFTVATLFDQQMELYKAFTIEQAIRKQFKDLKYITYTHFAGQTECFNLDAEQIIIEGLEKTCQE